ncbi:MULTISPECIES: hypothetical protein [Flavobacterium]|uniref:hypothetical protein n=1 Tax=Flavobacterium TaxID=237 RepID=UPI002113A3F6|nr:MULTISPECIES: hypothetical protein [Flavobacterium]UUF12453.1 hypothetical protein NLJ00_14450 [Flavobacterium panici]
MLKHKLIIKLLIVIVLLTGSSASAQLDGLLQKAKDKAGEVIEKEANNKRSTASLKNPARTISAPSNFHQGDTLIFDENFSKYNTGATAGSFKTNGAAIVASVEQQKGKWMVLQDKATFKFSKALKYPKRFTVEFDILALGDKITDISPLSFGFATDNSASEYTSNAGSYVELHYYDANMVNIGSSNPQKFVNTTYDLAQDLNQPLHVALFIDKDTMTVYLNNTKLADTVLFSPGAAKNFFITAPWQYKNEAKVLVSNFKISAFRN